MRSTVRREICALRFLRILRRDGVRGDLAYYAWGSYWVWTPKEIWSVIVWIYFATLTHLKFIPAQEEWPGWTKRLEMGATAAGYGVVLLTFLGVSLLLRSSHSF